MYFPHNWEFGSAFSKLQNPPPRYVTGTWKENLYESHYFQHTAHVADGSANAIMFPSNTTKFCTGCSCTQNLFTKHIIITTSINFRTGINIP
jgi:hypothetical protein